MKTIGEQQNFQTLFCELRLEDESMAPRFSVVWNIAQARPRSRVGFTFAFAAASVLLVISLLSLALWLGGRASNQKQESATVSPPASPAIIPSPRATEATPGQVAPLRANNRVNSLRRAMKTAERRRLKALALGESEILNALAVSSWQSPTAMLMQSPADDVLVSLPQLYRSVTQMNSFLPDTQ